MFISRNAKLAIDKFPDETIIVDLESGSYYSLRGGATAIWNCVEAGINEQEIVDVFADLENEQKQHLFEFFNQLKECKLIEEFNGAGSSPNIKRKFEPILFERYDDMQELILLDPIHEVDARGWPHQKNETAG